MSQKILEGKVAIVTGAAGAIGYGICDVLLQNGCTVVATDLPGEKLEQFAKDLDAIAPGKSIGLPLDVTDEESAKTAVETVCEKYGRVDIMVHNAGIAYVAKIVDMDLKRFQLLEKVNVDGTLIVLAEAGRRFIKPADHIEKGCFARPGGSHDGHIFTCLDVKVDSP